MYKCMREIWCCGFLIGVDLVPRKLCNVQEGISTVHGGLGCAKIVLVDGPPVEIGVLSALPTAGQIDQDVGEPVPNVGLTVTSGVCAERDCLQEFLWTRT